MVRTHKGKIRVSSEWGSVSYIYMLPEDTKVIMVLCHGAGAGMDHPFMEDLARALAQKRIGTLRFNFLYKEKGGGPDRPPKAHAAIHAAVMKAKKRAGDIPVWIGGKSYGGRMASLLAAGEGLKGVRGLVYYGFPLHPPGKPGTERAGHLGAITLPQLFIQGTRDNLATFALIEKVTRNIRNAELVKMDGGDHSFKILKSSGVSHESVMDILAEETASFVRKNQA